MVNSTKSMSDVAGQRGLSLVELLVAMVLGLLLAAALVQVYVSSRGVFTMQDSSSRLQEGGRFALGFMSEDVRMAGFIGCPAIDRLAGGFFNDHAASGLTSATIIGSMNDVAAGNARGALAGTDVLVVRKATSEGRPVVVASGSGNGVALEIGGGEAVTAGTQMIVSNCISADVISTTGASSTNGTPPTTTITANTLTIPYGIDAEVFGYDVVEYFVADTGRGTTALFVDRGGAAEELVEGVQDMQLEFGVDNVGTDRSADDYDATPANWEQVVSLRINLLLQSNDANVIASAGAQAQAIQFMGVDVPADGRLRQVFSSTIAIRNRLP